MKPLPAIFAGAFLLVSCHGGNGPDHLPTAKVVSGCDDSAAWKVAPMAGSRAEAAIIEEGGGRALEIRYEMQRPDLNSSNLSTGVIVELTKPDFRLNPGEALAIRLLWQAGQNSLRVELQDEDGRGRMYEIPDLARSQGWQEVLIAPEQLEPWGQKFVPGKPGKIKSLKLVLVYSWTPGPGRILIDELRVVKKPASSIPTLSVSQLGYRPADPKFLVARLEGAGPAHGRFRFVSLSDGKTVLEGKLEKTPFSDWPGSYYRGDFSSLAIPGRYQADVSFDGALWHRSEAFEITPRIFDEKTSRLVFDFLANLHSDDPRIFGFPELGGYRDAGTMQARYMNTNPHVLYGAARYIESAAVPKSDSPKIRFAVEELEYGVQSMLAWQKPDGSVVSSIVRDPDYYPHNQNPEENTRRWKTTEGNLSATLTYPPAMAAAARALAPYNPELSARALAAARKTYAWAGLRANSKQSTSLGHLLWGAIELYRATHDASYLARARSLATQLCGRQFLDYSRTPHRICGNISNSGRSLNLDYQYKVIHELGMYLGLIELLPHLPPEDSLHADVRFALQTFARQYLLAMSSLTPYGQIAEGLELNDDGSMRVALFHPPTGRLGAQSHGLNCDHLAYAYMGARLADILGMPELDQFASNQAQWIFGVNPLGLSMMSGVGGRQGRSLDEYLGLKPLPGGIMNGIVGREGEIPYWALHWVSGEYWLPQNAYYMALTGELERPRDVASQAEKTALQARMQLPQQIRGGEPLKIHLLLENPSEQPVSATVHLRSRGSHSSDESIPVEIGSGKRLEIVRAAEPTGRCAPLLVSAAIDGHLLDERFALPDFPPYQPPPSNFSPLRPVAVKASSVQRNEPNVGAENAIDGNPATRWSSEFSDPQWLEIDLGSPQTIGKATIQWETAYSEAYRLEVSEDGTSWNAVHSVDDEDGGFDEILLAQPVRARFLKLTCLRRGTPYGNAIFEFKIFGIPTNPNQQETR